MWSSTWSVDEWAWIAGGVAAVSPSTIRELCIDDDPEWLADLIGTALGECSVLDVCVTAGGEDCCKLLVTITVCARIPEEPVSFRYSWLEFKFIGFELRGGFRDVATKHNSHSFNWSQK